MSELMMTRGGHKVRRGLLSTVSAMTLLLSAASMGAAFAEDAADRPNVWIELGVQAERNDGSQQPFAPPFVLTQPRPAFETISPIDTQRLPRYSVGGEGRIVFEPDNTHWVLAAGIRYGRSNGKKIVHQQTVAAPYPVVVGTYHGYLTQTIEKFAHTEAKHHSSYTVLDFMAGQDVGLGLFGGHGKSVFSLGVRYAQFSNQSHVSISSDPDFHVTLVQIPWFPSTYPPVPFSGPHHAYKGVLDRSHNFHGMGPSVSWEASAPLTRSNNEAEISLDWGLNASVLFGRQKARTSHRTTGFYYPKYISAYSTNVAYRNPTTPGESIRHPRSRSVVVPNVGGFAGLSFRYANAKVSLGYRADFFFGAMDTGVDGRHTSDRNFYGPFARIGIGLGG
jgi:hypothetical protein